MFKRILLPTDGSAASAAAVEKTVLLARRTGASIVGLYVLPSRPLFSAVLGVLTAPEHEERAKEYLGYIEQCAAQANVPATSITRHGDAPYETIIATARDEHCDLIAMASHGRRGVKGVLLGSQTQGVLAYSAIPTLVLR